MRAIAPRCMARLSEDTMHYWSATPIRRSTKQSGARQRRHKSLRTPIFTGRTRLPPAGLPVRLPFIRWNFERRSRGSEKHELELIGIAQQTMPMIRRLRVSGI